MNRFTWSLIAVLTILVLVFTGCTTPAEETSVVTEAVVETEEAPAEMEPVEGGVFNIGIYEFVQFDPPMVGDTSSFVVSQIFSYLFRSTSDMDTIPDFATHWEVSEDGMTYTFYLREGVYFHDGNEVFPEGESREVTAADVVYSLERTVTLEGTQASADILQTFESVEAIDDYTVAVHLNAPNALLFSPARGIADLAIVPQEAVEHFGEAWPQNPIGTGPFKLISYTPDDSVVLERNELYWKRPLLDGVTFKIIPDADAQLIALEAGEIHWAGLPSTDYERFADDPNYVIQPYDCPGSYHMQFHLRDETMQQIEVREAIAHAVDGQNIIKAVSPGEYRSGCGIAGPGVPGYNPDVCENYFSYDPELSAEILTEAGWEKNADDVWEKDGEVLTLEMEMWNSDPMPKVGDAVSTQLQEAGFDVNLLTVEFGTWIDDIISNGETTKPIMFWSGFCGEGGLHAFYSDSGNANVQMGYEDEAVFALLGEANVMFNQDERNSTLMQASDLIYASYPAIPLGFTISNEILDVSVQDWLPYRNLMNIVTEANNIWLAP